MKGAGQRLVWISTSGFPIMAESRHLPLFQNVPDSTQQTSNIQLNELRASQNPVRVSQAANPGWSQPSMKTLIQSLLAHRQQDALRGGCSQKRKRRKNQKHISSPGSYSRLWERGPCDVTSLSPHPGSIPSPFCGEKAKPAEILAPALPKNGWKLNP